MGVQLSVANNLVHVLKSSYIHMLAAYRHIHKEYTTSIKRPRFGNLTKFLSIVLMKISSPDSDLALKS